jgi:hypothetical protein
VAALYQTNVEGTRNLLSAFADARRGRGGTFIYISSTESAALTLFFILLCLFCYLCYFILFTVYICIYF